MCVFFFLFNINIFDFTFNLTFVWWGFVYLCERVGKREVRRM